MPTAADRLFSAVVRVRGSEDEELYHCIDSITVREDLNRGSSFQLRLAACRNDDGSWPHLDEENLRPWNRITLLAAFPDHSDVIFDGYISHVHPSLNRQAGALSVDLRGVDASYEMNLEEKTRVWEGKTYEQIAQEIVDGYGFDLVLPTAAGNGGASGSGEGGGEGEPPAVTQRATDRAFLAELARRKGYELFVRGAEVHFHPPDLTGTPQKLIAVQFGEETNCDQLEVQVDGTRPTRAVMSAIDPTSGQPATVESTDSGLPALGSEELASMRGFGAPQRTVVVRRRGAMSEAQMREYTQGLLRRHAWWVQAQGVLDGLRYGAVLRSKRLVTIKGLGSLYNGNYYVERVVHQLGPRTYRMQFVAVRNALGQLGSEDFEGEQPDAATPPAALAGGDPEVVRVRESGNRVQPA